MYSGFTQCRKSVLHQLMTSIILIMLGLHEYRYTWNTEFSKSVFLPSMIKNRPEKKD